MCQRRHVDYPGWHGVQHSGQQQERKQKMPQMIGGEMKFDAILRQRFWTHHYTYSKRTSFLYLITR